MPPLDSYVGFARETTYGTPVTPTRSFEAEADELDLQLQHLERRGLRAGAQGVHSGGVRTIVRGAAGRLPLTVLDQGFGMIFRALAGSSASALAGGAASAFLQQHDEDSSGPTGESLTYQIVKATLTGTQPFTYHGVKIPSWELVQSREDYLKLNLDLDAEDVDTATAAHTEAHVAGTTGYGWPDLAVTVGGAAVDLRDFTFRADNRLKTDRHYLRASRLKKEALRTGIPAHSGTMTADFEDTTQYDRIVAGDVVALEATWTLSDIEIESGFNPFLKLTLPAVQLRARTPQVQVDGDELPAQPIDFTVLWNGTDPAYSLDYQTADTDF